MSKRILIVDDSPTVRMAVRLALEKAGYEALEEDNPIVVPLRVRREKVALVLLDVQMPLLQGDKVAKLLKPATLEAKIILHSTLSQAELEVKVAESGADGLIRKSGDHSGLVAKVTALIGGPED